MSYLSQFSWNFRAKTHLYGSIGCPWSWKRAFACPLSRRIITFNPSIANTRLNSGSRHFSSKKKSIAQKPKPESEMEKEKEEFYVVRKGDAIGVYKSLAECQSQAGSSISDPPISVFKGSNLTKSSEKYLAARGLKNAVYAINVGDFKEGLFGNLLQCSLQDPTKKRSHIEAGIDAEPISSISMPSNDPSKHAKVDDSSYRACVIKFDGASKGNPGSAGAGVVMQTDSGNLICKLREGVGEATNNVAEYRALLLGLKYALEKGYEKVTVYGDSKLVCMQVQGLWKAKHKTIMQLHEEALKLKDQFKSFEIHHVMRANNSEADAQANLGVTLDDGEVIQDE